MRLPGLWKSRQCEDLQTKGWRGGAGSMAQPQIQQICWIQVSVPTQLGYLDVSTGACITFGGGSDPIRLIWTALALPRERGKPSPCPVVAWYTGSIATYDCVVSLQRDQQEPQQQFANAECFYQERGYLLSERADLKTSMPYMLFFPVGHNTV